MQRQELFSQRLSFFTYINKTTKIHRSLKWNTPKDNVQNFWYASLKRRWDQEQESKKCSQPPCRLPVSSVRQKIGYTGGSRFVPIAQIQIGLCPSILKTTSQSGCIILHAKFKICLIQRILIVRIKRDPTVRAKVILGMRFPRKKVREEAKSFLIFLFFHATRIEKANSLIHSFSKNKKWKILISGGDIFVTTRTSRDKPLPRWRYTRWDYFRNRTDRQSNRTWFRLVLETCLNQESENVGRHFQKRNRTPTKVGRRECTTWRRWRHPLEGVTKGQHHPVLVHHHCFLRKIQLCVNSIEPLNSKQVVFPQARTKTWELSGVDCAQ